MRYKIPQIHRHPTVEYIPLTPQILFDGPAWPNLNYGKSDLIIRESDRGWAEISDGVPKQAKGQLTPLGPGEIGIITLNLKILEIMYRANTTTIVAEEIPDHLGIYTITKNFFYKPTIIFEAYNLKGSKLAWAKLELKK